MAVGLLGDALPYQKLQKKICANGRKPRTKRNYCFGQNYGEAQNEKDERMEIEGSKR